MQRSNAYKTKKITSHPIKECSPQTPLPNETGMISRKKALPLVAAILSVRMELESGAALQVSPS